MARIFIYVFIAIALLVAILFWAFPEVNLTDEKLINFVSLILVSSYLLLALFQKRLNLSEAFRSILIWVGLALVLMIGYVYRFELMDIKTKLTSNLYPSNGNSEEKGEVYFAAASDGHFYVAATVNGVKIRFMVDTGASRVVISPRDAQRLGIKTEDLTFNSQSSTANGIIWDAPITLESITVENHTINDVRASVSQSELDVSLLGVSYLDKLKGYKVEKGGLTLQY